jgi:hypothetical protein
VRIYDLLLGPPSSQARLANHLNEAAGQFGVEQASRREVDVEVKALWTLATWV